MILLVFILFASSVAYADEEQNIERNEEMLQLDNEGLNPNVEDREEDIQEEKYYGWYKSPETGDWYYYDTEGRKVYGWIFSSGKWYYLDGGNTEKPGIMVSNVVKQINGRGYCFDSTGAMLTGWIKRAEGWYYASASGAVLTGWFIDKGKWYYLDGQDLAYPGRMVSSSAKIVEGRKYYFDGSGAMLTGWIKCPEGWYYANVSGEFVSGWLRWGDRWYYLEGSNIQYPGLMLKNCSKNINGKEYYFNSDGAMRAGWYSDGGNWYYYDTFSGQQVRGWKNINGYWYYMDPLNSNKMIAASWATINNKKYYFYSSGAMATNWISYSGNWYYLGEDGGMRTGWQIIDGNWYYFYKANDSNGGAEGVMAKNVKIDGYQLSSNGAMLSIAQAQMSLKAQPYVSSTQYLILVDRAACKVGVFQGKASNWGMIKFWDCAPGKPSTPTVSGVFTVQGKGHHFDSGSARCYWYTQFRGNYLFHSVLYNKYTGRLQDGRVGMQLSHGCVRLQIDNAKWIYDNIPRGTKVVIY